MTSLRISLGAGASLLTLGLLAGCDGGGVEPPPPPTPSAVTVISGNSQTGRAGVVLADPITVRVTSSTGDELEGISVSFTAGASSGSVSSPTVATDANGRASVTWTLGTGPGQDIDTVRASVSGVSEPAVFTASVTADIPATLTMISGNGQSGAPGQPLPQPLVVATKDQFDNPAEGVTVNWSLVAGVGTLSASTSTTGADGQASVTWTPGGTGANTVHASVQGLAGSPVSFSAFIIAPTTQLSIASGNNQTGDPGAPLPNPIVVALTGDAGPVSGVPVSWAVTSGGGTVSQSSVTTDAQGRGSVSWTLGLGPDAQSVVATVPGAIGSPVTFNAVVRAMELVIVSGDNQTGAPGALLPQSLVAELKSEAGSPVAGVPVLWAVTVGSGTVSQPSVLTDGQGRSSVTWTLGPALGAQAATATVPNAAGSPLAFDAIAEVPPGIVTIASIAPSPMVEGQSATLTGSGFSITSSANTVTIGGASANVTGATTSSLTVTVPTFDCRPARDVPVQVTVNGDASNVLSQLLHPASFTTVALGQQLLLDDPAEFCLQFAPSSADEEYLIGVQSTSEVVTSLTPVTLTAVASGSAGRIEPLPEVSRPLARGRVSPLDERRAARMATHRRAELALRASDRRTLAAAAGRRLGGPSDVSRSSASAIPPNVAVGDLVSIRVPDIRVAELCTNYTEITTIVRAVGTRGVWLEDLDNPLGGYNDADFLAFSDILDNSVYNVDADYFGSPTDVDANGRLAVVITKVVNQFDTGTLGFVVSGDLVPRAFCASSNQGEVYYSIAPDPTGIYSTEKLTREEGLRDQPLIMAHEFVHIIHYGHVIFTNPTAPLPSQWFLEGQGTLAEEVVGFAVQGRSSRNNYGAMVALDDGDPSTLDWYHNKFADLAGYFGADFENRDRRVEGAPEECSWIDDPPASSVRCQTRSLYLSWSLLRWIADQYGPGFPGGEQGLQQTLIRSPQAGYERLATVLGVPFNTLLAGWAATLYTDDRVAGLDQRLTLASWNLFDIFNAARETARLVPRSRGFTSFTDDFNVRAGSSAYVRMSGNGRSATAVRARNSSDGPLPPIMQVFVVRLR